MAVVGNIDFLARDVLYDKQKPYRMKFVPPSGFPWSNIKTNIQPQKIEDIRGREKDFSLGANGFSLETLDSGMTYEDFDDEDKIVQTYLPNVAKLLRSMLSPSRIQIFEFLVRKRGESFPLATETAYEDHQPTTAAHIDMTQEWASILARRLNHKSGIHRLPGEHYQFINVWAPIRGPVQDWPLALCDASSLNLHALHAGDVVFQDFQTENLLLEHHPEHRWYYVSEQMPTQAWVFLQGDSRGRQCVPHSSFLHPGAPEKAQPRQSIEVRALVFTT